MANCNYKVILKDIQNKYKFKIFCTGNGSLTDYYTKEETNTLLANKEDTSNKVTSMSSSSTDTQYPSAKAVYDSQDAQDTQISNLQEENDYLTSIINQLPKVTGEGTDLTLNNTLNAKMDLDLKGNTYQGGEPTPDTPQDIEVVTGNNTIKVEGKNLFDGLWETGSINDTTGENVSNSEVIRSVNYIPIKPNVTYTISANNNASIFVHYYDENKNYLTNNNALNTPKTITPQNAYFMKIRTRQTENITRLDFECQVEQGSQATTYEAYKGQNYPINLGSLEMCTIGTYPDRIYKNNGNWFLHKVINKVVLTGGEEMGIPGTNVGEGLTAFRIVINSTNMYDDYTQAFSNMFRFTARNLNQWNNDEKDIANTGVIVDFLGQTAFYCRVKSSLASTVAEFRTFLQNNEVVLYIPLTIPTEIQITDTTLISQLEAIKEATSYSPQTNISQVYADAPFNITASTLLDLSSILNDLETRVSVLETE